MNIGNPTQFTRVYLGVVLLLLTHQPCRADSSQGQVPEYRLKAAYIYKILPFVHWPEDSHDEETLHVGVFGTDAYEAARDLVDGRPVKSKNKKAKKVCVTKLSEKDLADITTAAEYPALHNCQVVFISASCKTSTQQVLRLVRDRSVLTFGESDMFLEAGGIIRFVAEGKKVKFEINLVAARRARLKVDSQLLRLAKRVVKSK